MYMHINHKPTIKHYAFGNNRDSIMLIHTTITLICSWSTMHKASFSFDRKLAFVLISFIVITQGYVNVPVHTTSVRIYT